MKTDTELQQAVLAELDWEPSVTAAHIGVTAKSGVVTLTGHVESFAEKHAAEMAAGRISGVKAVAEEIEVRLPFETKRNDAEIAAAALARLAWNSSLTPDSVKVKVEKGWITLTGEVDGYFQKKAAQEDVRRLHGVVGVSDQTTIKPSVNTNNISGEIMGALNRSWFFEPNAVKVSAVEGKIRLSGTVHSLHERKVAGAIAWAALGATAVENNLAIV